MLLLELSGMEPVCCSEVCVGAPVKGRGLERSIEHQGKFKGSFSGKVLSFELLLCTLVNPRILGFSNSKKRVHSSIRCRLLVYGAGKDEL